MNPDDKQLKFVLGSSCPIEVLCSWKRDIEDLDLNEPDAACLVTSNIKPSGRMVLIKDIQKEGLVFFTNYNSKKAQDIAQNPNVALLFYFDALQRQVRVEGICEKTSSVLSDAYFNSRPYESQISALASIQSSVLNNRQELEDTMDSLRLKYPKSPPRPHDWGGFIIKPEYFEFWLRGNNRTHNRVCFKKNDSGWEKFLLQP